MEFKKMFRKAAVKCLQQECASLEAMQKYYVIYFI